ncbi:MAG: hypothetical protein R3B81_01725 [bacterium]
MIKIVPDALSKLLTDLIGRPVAATPGPPASDLVGLGGSSGVAAIYRDPEGAASAACVADIAAAASLGAALSLMPAAQAKACVKSGELSENLMENYGEVCNVIASLIGQLTHKSASLDGVQSGAGAPTEDVRRLLANGGARLDVNIRVEGYDDGRVTLLVNAG